MGTCPAASPDHALPCASEFPESWAFVSLQTPACLPLKVCHGCAPLLLRFARRPLKDAASVIGYFWPSAHTSCLCGMDRGEQVQGKKAAFSALGGHTVPSLPGNLIREGGLRLPMHLQQEGSPTQQPCKKLQPVAMTEPWNVRGGRCL